MVHLIGCSFAGFMLSAACCICTVIGDFKGADSNFTKVINIMVSSVYTAVLCYTGYILL